MKLKTFFLLGLECLTLSLKPASKRPYVETFTWEFDCPNLKYLNIEGGFERVMILKKIIDMPMIFHIA
jgi:hypothetical protein